MKNTLFTLLGILILFLPAQTQNFIVKYQSPAGQMPAFLDNIINQGNMVSQDFDGNGIPDLAVFQFDDNGNNTVNLNIYNGFGLEVLFGQTFIVTPNVQGDIPTIVGYTDFGNGLTPGTGTTSIIIRSATTGIQFDTLPPNVTNIITILNTSTNQADYCCSNCRLLAITDMDNDGYPDMIIGDMQAATLKIVGVDTQVDPLTGEGENTFENYALDFRDDYTLSLKYESETDQFLAWRNLKFNSLDDLDLQGDGIPELTTLITSEGEVEGMKIFDGLNHTNVWGFSFPQEHFDNILGGGFHGFFDLNGDGEKEVLLGNNLVVTLDQTVHPIGENFVIQAIQDIDGDAIPELLGTDTVQNVIQVWGKSTTTSTSAYQKILGQLLQNYPNPFSEKTRIEYNIAAPGQVKLLVFDANGILVEVLVNEKQTPGSYQVLWDPVQSFGIPLACGHYYYQLQVDGHVQTNKMIMIH